MLNLGWLRCRNECIYWTYLNIIYIYICIDWIDLNIWKLSMDMKRITCVLYTRESLQIMTAAGRWNGFSRGILVHFSRHSNELRHSKGRSTAAGKSCAAQHLPGGEIHPRLMVPPVPWVLDMIEKHLDDISKSVAKLICASPTELKGLEDLHIQKNMNIDRTIRCCKISLAGCIQLSFPQLGTLRKNQIHMHFCTTQRPPKW